MTRHELYKSFLHEFPISALKDMPLERYTNLNKKDSFCYWLEGKTHELGSISGGNSYKFGIYRFKNKPGKVKYAKHDDEYAWNAVLGNTAREAYSNVLKGIVKIANYAKSGYFDRIDTIDVVWPIVRRKIAFLYSEEKLLPIYNRNDFLIPLAEHFGLENADKVRTADLYYFIFKKKGKQDIYSFYDKLLSIVKGTEDTSDKKNYWWLVANPKIWSMASMEVGEEQNYTLYSDSGHKRNIFQNFLEAHKGDAVIGYEATPVKKIVALAEISKDTDTQNLYITKDESLPNPIGFDVIKDIPELKEMEFFKNRGSLFKLTKEEYDVIMNVIREQNPIRQEKKFSKYDKNSFIDEVFMSLEQYDKLRNLLKYKKNIILQGAPGVGKTFCAKRLAYSIIGEQDDDRVVMIQFHQNYSYEDFMMGYRPDGDGFSLKEGIFYKFCKKALNDPDKPYFFIIDEINRGNLSKIFGELLMLIEKDYRNVDIRLAYNDEPFTVPANLYIIGMMNTADRSLAMIDYAIRRRFCFFNMKPAFDSDGFVKLKKEINDPTFNKVIEGIKALNDDIRKDSSLGEGFCIGHSYFCGRDNFIKDKLKSIIEYDIKPMLHEYWFDNDSKYTEECTKLDEVFR